MKRGGGEECIVFAWRKDAFDIARFCIVGGLKF